MADETETTEVSFADIDFGEEPGAALASLDSVAKELDTALRLNTEKLLSSASTQDQFSAFDSLEALDLASTDVVENNIVPDTAAMAREFASQSEAGTLERTLTKLRNGFDSKFVADGEQLFTEDVSAIVARGGITQGETEDIQSLRSILTSVDGFELIENEGRLPATSDKVVRTINPATGQEAFVSETEAAILFQQGAQGTDLGRVSPVLSPEIIFKDRPEDVSAHISDYFFDSVELGKKNKRQRESMKLAALDMALNVQGFDGEAITSMRQELQGLEVPLLSPVDLLVDIGTGVALAKGISIAGKQLLKGSSRGLRTAVGEEVFFGQLAGGFMSLADVAGAGPLVNLMSGIIGPSATAGVFLTSRRGLSSYIQALRANRDTTIFRDLSKAAKTHEDTKVGSVITEIIEELETGKINLEGERVEMFPQSPLATAAKNGEGDEGAVAKITEAATLSLAGDPEDAATVLASKAMGTGSATHVSLLPDIPSLTGEIPTKTVSFEGLEGRTELQGFVKNSFDIRDTVANHFFHDTTGTTSDFPDLVQSRIYKDNSVYFGGMAAKAEKSFFEGKLKPGKRVWQPDLYFGDLADMFVKIPAQLEKGKRSLVKAGQDILDNHIYKGLSEPEAKQLDDISRHGTDRDEVLEVVDGGLRSPTTGETYNTSDKVVESYYRSSFLMDSVYDAANQTAIQTFKNQGFQQLDGSFVAQKIRSAVKGTDLEFGFKDIDGAVWSREMQENGYTAVKIVNTDNLKDERNLLKFLAPDQSNRLGDIPSTLAVLPRREGYRPFRIKKEEKKFFVTKVDRDPTTKEFKVGKVAAASTKKEANTLIGELSKLDGNTTYIAHRSGEAADFMDMSVDRSFAQAMRKMDDKELKLFAAALKREGVDAEEVGAIVSYAKTFGFQKRPEFKARGKQRLRGAESLAKELQAGKPLEEALAAATEAPLEPTRAAMANYIESVSKFISFADWNAKLKDDFMGKYGSELGITRWNDPIPFQKLSDEQASKTILDLATEAEEVQSQMRRIFELPDRKQVQDEELWRSRADKMYETERFKPIGAAIDNYLSSGLRLTTTRGLKKLAATTKLGLFNWSQFFVQQTAGLNAFKYAGTNPKALVDGIQDFNAAYTKAMIGGKLGLEVDESSKNLLALIEKSGANTGMNFEYADNVMKQTSGWSGKFTAKAGSVIRAGFLPMQAGEAVGRGAIWFTERRVLMDEIQKGLHPRLKKKDIDSDAFILETNMRTDSTAGNFTRFNQAFTSREGWVSAMTQFWSYPIFQLGVMNPFGKNLSTKQKVGVWGAWTAAFGIEGVPAFWDIVAVGEQGAALAGHPEAVGATKRTLLSASDSDFVKRAITKGLLTAGSQGEVDFANRAGLADVAGGFIDGLAFSDLAGPGANILVGMATGAVESTRQFQTLVSSGEFNRESISKAILPAVKEVSGIANPLKASFNKLNNREEATMTQRLQQAIGIKPGIDVEISEMKFDAFKYNKAFKEYYWDEAKRISGLFPESPKSGEEELRKQIAFLMRKNPVAARGFMQAFKVQMQGRVLDPALQAELIQFKKGLDPGIYPK